MNYQEIKTILLQTYKYKLELHAHSHPASECSEISPEKVVETFKNSGYDGIAITNHFYAESFERYFKAENKRDGLNKYLSDYYRASEHGDKVGLKVYLAAELRWSDINSNDYLIYGIDEYILSDIYDYMHATPEEFARDCKNEKSFFVQAHPFRNGITRTDASLLDGIEAFNMHPNHNSRIALATKFADENNKIKTIGSDYHHEGHHGLCATRTKILPSDSFELAAELRKNDFIAETGNSIFLP